MRTPGSTVSHNEELLGHYPGDRDREPNRAKIRWRLENGFQCFIDLTEKREGIDYKRVLLQNVKPNYEVWQLGRVEMRSVRREELCDVQSEIGENLRDLSLCLLSSIESARSARLILSIKTKVYLLTSDSESR
jgi:hypothetical protein